MGCIAVLNNEVIKMRKNRKLEMAKDLRRWQEHFVSLAAEAKDEKEVAAYVLQALRYEKERRAVLR